MSNNYLKFLLFLSFLSVLSWVGFTGCGADDTNSSAQSDGDADSDTDADADGDGDTDADGDTDTDGDSDSDADGDGDGDTDGDSDTDGDTDTDADSDSDNDSEGDEACAYQCSDHCMSEGGTVMTGNCDNPDQKCCDFGEGDADSDTDADTDSDSDTDTDGDADTDGDTDTDTDADGDTDTDSDADGDGGLTIYYIRHAETVANTLGPGDEMTFESANMWSDKGQEQVDTLTDWLINSGEVPVPDQILSSPTWRGQFTILPYLVEMDMQAEVWPELTEVEEDPVTGASVPVEIEQESYIKYHIGSASLDGSDPDPDAVARLSYREGTTEGAYFPENFEEGLTVVMMSYDLLMEKFSRSGKTLFITGHAHAGSLLLGLLEGYDMINDAPSGHYLQNTGVQHIEQDPETGVFEVIDTNINLESQWDF